MRIRELLDELSITGNTIAKIAKEKAGIGEKRLKQALHNAGYQFSNSGQKGWFFVGEGEEPLDKSILDFVSSSSVKKKSSHTNSPNVKRAKEEVMQAMKESSPTISHENEMKFTQEEMRALKEMLSEFMREKEHQTKRDILHKRIMKLEKGEKIRKTIVINENVGALLDKFAEEKRCNKSDLLEIAILDLINRYE